MTRTAKTPNRRLNPRTTNQATKDQSQNRQTLVTEDRQSNQPGPDRDDRGRTSKWLAVVVAGLTVAVIGLTLLIFRDYIPSGSTSANGASIPAAYDADRAYRVLVQLCEIGRRPSGSDGMKRQQQMLRPIFEQLGGRVTLQTFEIRHPEDGSVVPMANMIASWYPNRPKRFLVCAHYDTRPYPDQDRRNSKGVFIGANDGASGTAALVELAHHLSDLPKDVGVDLVLFDGEEFVWQQGRDDYFLGAKFFSEKYKASPPEIRYQAGILLDMVGDRELKIFYERNSMRYARDLAKSIWSTADRLNVKAFVPRIRHELQDDHLPLNQVAGIPTVDLIDFDYPRIGVGAPSYWHTEQDIPENCSGQSIATVVWVVHEWLKQQ